MADSSERQEIVNSNITNSQVTLEQQNITNNYIQQLPPTKKQWPRRQRLLLEKMQSDIKQRLAYIDNREVLIPLTVAEQRKAVSGPELKLKRQLKTTEGETEVTSRRMIDIFLLPEVGRKLLILGNPEAGKTTTLLQLADELVAQALAAPRSAIPIVFELSAWKDDNQNIWDWLKIQLKQVYAIKPDESEAWLQEELLLPLLDGLDELGMERQETCIRAINQFVSSKAYSHVVVCCRLEEYYIAQQHSGAELEELRGAVVLEPLSDWQIKSYLDQVGQSKLWKAIQTKPEMASMLVPSRGEAVGLLRVPLLLNVAAVAYEGKAFRTKGELFEAYIEKRLSYDIRRQERQLNSQKQKKWSYSNTAKEPNRQSTRHYLSYLAWQLKQIYKTELFLEQMQPCWLPKEAQRTEYAALCVAIQILPLVILLIASETLYFAWMFGFFSLFRFVLFSIDESEDKKITLRESFGVIFLSKAFFTETARKDVLWVIVYALFLYVVFGSVAGAMALPIIIFSENLSAATTQDVGARKVPDQGTWNSVKNMILVSAVLLPFCLSWIILLEPVGWEKNIFIGIALAASVGFFFGGGQPFVQHCCLRFFLAHHRYTPYRYIRFLNYCEERKLLQNIGDRYRFIHRELQDHFANQYRP